MNKLICTAAALAAVAFAAPAMAQSGLHDGHGFDHRDPPPDHHQERRPEVRHRRPPGTGSGTAVVSAAGVRSVTGGVVGLASGDTPQASQFTVAGEGGQSISVTIPATFSMANGTDTLVVTTSNNLTGSAANPDAQQRPGRRRHARLQGRRFGADRRDDPDRRLLRDLHGLGRL